MTNADDERIARQRLDDAIDRLVRRVEREGVSAARREYAVVNQTIDRLVQVTREAAPRKINP